MQSSFLESSAKKKTKSEKVEEEEKPLFSSSSFLSLPPVRHVAPLEPSRQGPSHGQQAPRPSVPVAPGGPGVTVDSVPHGGGPAGEVVEPDAVGAEPAGARLQESAAAGGVGDGGRGGGGDGVDGNAAAGVAAVVGVQDRGGARDRGVAQLLFSGGEPLERFDELLELTASASAESDIWILSSGMGLTAGRAARLD